jgi:BioD-like phosphotransacetylase family protein
MVAQALSMGDETGCQFTSITDADTAHTVKNLKKLNFEVFEHPLYSLDLTPSDSPVRST